MRDDMAADKEAFMALSDEDKWGVVEIFVQALDRLGKALDLVTDVIELAVADVEAM